PSLVPGNSSWTAWAVTCPVEWRRMSRPASESMVIGAIESPALSSRLRSAGSPLSHIAMTVRSEEKISVPVSPSFQGMLSPAQSMLSATDLLHSSAVRTSRPQDSSTDSVVPNQLGGSHATATHAELAEVCEPARTRAEDAVSGRLADPDGASHCLENSKSLPFPRSSGR